MSVSRADSTPQSETATVVPSNDATNRRFYLLVLDGETSSMCPLPHNGVVNIGRDAQAHVALEEVTASRRHAKIVVKDGEARLIDLDSHNGTKVNGELIEEATVLVGGDVISVGSAHIIVQGSAGGLRRPNTPMAWADLRQRLSEEVTRARTFERSVALLAVQPEEPRHLASVERALVPELRDIDLLARDGKSTLFVLLPEVSPGAALREAQNLIAPFKDDIVVRAGVATCPADATDADTLVAAARAAAADAPPRSVIGASEAVRVMEIGDLEAIVADPAMVRLYELIDRLAQSDLAVLICGETGCGKEYAARALHYRSPRAAGPFVALNCAALQDTLVESELFGYVKGAFTGANDNKVGLLEQASGGTIFLDELGELAPSAQAKLLRALDTQKITRLGDVKEQSIDVRIVAATNRDLEEEIRAGRFRKDLHFRISAARVLIPPLRERPREIPILSREFLRQVCEAKDREPMEISPGALSVLAAHSWPGNIRELRNVIEYAAAVADSVVEAMHLPETVRGRPSGSAHDDPSSEDEEGRFRVLSEEVADLEKLRMRQALEATGGVQTRAAKLIGMPLRTFVSKLKRYDL